MSEKGNRNHELLEKYEAMTTEELKQLLREDSETEGGTDTEEILCVMEVLASRNKSEDTGNRAQKVWESFQTRYLPVEDETPEPLKLNKPKRPWWRPLAAVAAVLVLMVGITVTVDAFGWVDVWDAVARWAKETFSFVSNDQARIGEPAPENNVEYESFEEAIFDVTGQTDLVPTYVPEGCVIDKISIEEIPGRATYVASFSNGEKYFSVRVRPYSGEDTRWLEKSGETFEIYPHLEIDYYIFANHNQCKAVWIKDSYECYISGDLSVEEIKTMIDSIGKG